MCASRALGTPLRAARPTVVSPPTFTHLTILSFTNLMPELMMTYTWPNLFLPPKQVIFDILANRNEWWVPGKIVEARHRLAQYWKVGRAGRAGRAQHAQLAGRAGRVVGLGQQPRRREAGGLPGARPCPCFCPPMSCVAGEGERNAHRAALRLLPAQEASARRLGAVRAPSPLVLPRLFAAPSSLVLNLTAPSLLVHTAHARAPVRSARAPPATCCCWTLPWTSTSGSAWSAWTRAP